MTARIHVDARAFGGEGTGVSTYAATLLAAIRAGGREAGLVRTERPVGPLRRTIRAAMPLLPRLRAEGADLIGRDMFRLAQRRFGLTGRLLTVRAPGPPGIVHWSYPLPLAIAGWTNLYTVHDVIPLTHPDLSPIDPRRHARLLAAVAARADRVVTVSEAARGAIVAALGCDPALVVDCGQAVVPPPSIAPLPATRRPRGYFLFCGRIEPRKNLARLIAAHAAAATGLPLLLAGPVAEGGAAILAGAMGEVEHLGYLSRGDLSALIANARALLFPSLAEGFGLPVAEAMALGTPTLVSRDPSLIEVAGGAALVADAHDTDALAAAIARLARDDALCADLAARGRIRAGAFTLDVFAARLDALYRTVGG